MDQEINTSKKTNRQLEWQIEGTKNRFMNGYIDQITKDKTGLEWIWLDYMDGWIDRQVK